MASTGAVLYVSPRFLSGQFTQTTFLQADGWDNLAQWLPSSQVPIGWVTINGQQVPLNVNPVWYRFLNFVANVKLGGPNAPSIGQVVTNVEAGLTQSAATAQTVAAVSQQANANAQALAAAVEVSIGAGLPGASSIPEVLLTSQFEL